MAWQSNSCRSFRIANKAVSCDGDKPRAGRAGGGRTNRFLSVTERNRFVNSEGVVNQRFGEFWAEILGSGRNRGGSFRDLVGLSRNRDAGPAGETT